MMKSWIIATLFCIAGVAQTPSTSANPTGRQLIEQAIAALATAPEAATGQEFSLKGDLKDEGSAISRPIKILGRGIHDLRVETTLADGSMHKIVKSQSKGGTIQRGNTTIGKIQSNARAGTDVPFLPLPGLLSQLLKSAESVADEGLDSVAGRPAHHVAITRRFPSGADPDGLLASRSRIDLYLDSANLHVIKMQHTAADATGRWSVARSVMLDDYREVNGVLAPFLIEEMVDGQKISTITVTAVDLKPRLQDSDFQF
jgi:hypothetical protein